MFKEILKIIPQVENRDLKKMERSLGNQPEYTRKHASLIEDELTKVIQESYIDTGLIEDATVEVTLEQDNFVASGSFNISEPKALWRIVGEMRQTL
jgi:hypothetical protein